MRRTAFTVIELLVVVAVLAVLLTLLWPTLEMTRYRTNEAHCAARQRDLVAALTAYAVDNVGWYPHNGALRVISFDVEYQDYFNIRPLLEPYVNDVAAAINCPMVPYKKWDFGEAPNWAGVVSGTYGILAGSRASDAPRYPASGIGYSQRRLLQTDVNGNVIVDDDDVRYDSSNGIELGIRWGRGSASTNWYPFTDPTKIMRRLNDRWVFVDAPGFGANVGANVPTGAWESDVIITELIGEEGWPGVRRITNHPSPLERWHMGEFWVRDFKWWESDDYRIAATSANYATADGAVRRYSFPGGTYNIDKDIYWAGMDMFVLNGKQRIPHELIAAHKGSAKNKFKTK